MFEKAVTYFRAYLEKLRYTANHHINIIFFARLYYDKKDLANPSSQNFEDSIFKNMQVDYQMQIFQDSYIKIEYCGNN